MKKPLIPDFNRWIAQKVPDSNIAKRVEFTIALARLKREIGRIVKNLILR